MKLFSIALAISYLFLNSGIHIDMHFCEDNLTEISLSHQETKCNSAVMECCKSCDDIHIDLENDNDEFSETVPTKTDFAIKENQKIKTKPTLVLSSKNQTNLFYSGNNSPPKERVYILNCQLCFYG